MKKGLRILTIALVLIIAICLLTIIAYSLDTDSPASWAVTEVEMAKDLGLVPLAMQSNYSNATTRAEFCALAVAFYEKVTETTIEGRVKFTDTNDVNVEKVAYIGVVNGVGNNRFDPNASLTREQAATMLARLAESVSKPLEKKAATFADRGSIASWALEAVGQCEAAGIMGGTGNNQFSPRGAYQRQQSIATIMRMYDFIGGTGTPNPVTPTPTPAPTPPPSTGNDAVSKNALAGLWTIMGYSDRYWWEFGEDGSFAYYIATVANVDYWNEYFKKGKYRVNGDTIELYDCQFDTFSSGQFGGGRNAKYFQSERYDMPKNLLLSTPLQEPKDTSDFSLTFEFIDAMLLRIVTDDSSGARDNYDRDFMFVGNSHNVAIPTHSLPSALWPYDLLSPSIPEYRIPEYRYGRIRLVEPINETGYYFRVRIDKTTPEEIKDYIDGLIQAGWEPAYGDNSVTEFIEWVYRGSAGACYFSNWEENCSVSLEVSNELWSSQTWLSIIF